MMDVLWDGSEPTNPAVQKDEPAGFLQMMGVIELCQGTASGPAPPPVFSPTRPYQASRISRGIMARCFDLHAAAWTSQIPPSWFDDNIDCFTC